MARVEITEDELKAGAFPAVCAKTGEPTDHVEDVNIRLPHPRAYWLLLVAVVPFFVYRFGVAPRVTCRIPMSRSIVELRTRQRRFLTVIAVVALTVALAGALVPGEVGRLITIAAGLLIAFAAQAALFAARREATVGFTRTRYETVVVERIHPAFRDALAGGDPPAGAAPTLKAVPPSSPPTGVPPRSYEPSRSARSASPLPPG